MSGYEGFLYGYLVGVITIMILLFLNEILKEIDRK